MDTFIDLLDTWVVRNVDPPPSMSDWAEIGGTTKVGVVENPAIALPEIACPLGVYFQYPPSQKTDGAGTTGFVPFDGQGLEPLDGRGVFVDMNLNRYRDRRETLTEAWRRLGLIGPGESFTSERYAACVSSAVDRLQARRLLSPRMAQIYKTDASRRRFGTVPTRGDTRTSPGPSS